MRSTQLSPLDTSSRLPWKLGRVRRWATGDQEIGKLLPAAVSGIPREIVTACMVVTPDADFIRRVIGNVRRSTSGLLLGANTPEGSSMSNVRATSAEHTTEA